MTLRLRSPGTLDDLLNYRLTRLLAESGGPVVRLCEGRYGIARREWRIVALLAVHGALSPSALAEEGELDRPQTSRAIGSLVDKGLLERQEQRGDRRRAVVALTAAGQRLYDELFPQVAEINRRVLEALDDDAVAALDAAIDRLTRQAAALNRDAAGVSLSAEPR